VADRPNCSVSGTINALTDRYRGFGFRPVGVARGARLRADFLFSILTLIFVAEGSY
jgi:hypothetical protein